MVKNFLKSVKSILFADPNILYKEEGHLINQPFYFQGTNGKAVLLVHGWTSTPYEVRRLGRYLNENGYTVSAPMLKGHGTVPKDLENIVWTEWLADIEKEYQELKKTHAKVFLGGTSIGSNLAVQLAVKESDVAGLLLMATPYKLRLEKLAVLAGRFLSKFKNYNKKIYPPTFGAATTITRLISYQTYPIKSALETFNLIKATRETFPRVTQPCLIIQSASDHIVEKKSLEIIYQKISSAKKEKKYIKRAYHTFISDIKNEQVFEDILNFLEEN
jgi:carboxylesterase